MPSRKTFLEREYCGGVLRGCLNPNNTAIRGKSIKLKDLFRHSMVKQVAIRVEPIADKNRKKAADPARQLRNHAQ
jgi:hypothetical protein